MVIATGIGDGCQTRTVGQVLSTLGLATVREVQLIADLQFQDRAREDVLLLSLPGNLARLPVLPWWRDSGFAGGVLVLGEDSVGMKSNVHPCLAAGDDTYKELSPPILLPTVITSLKGLRRWTDEELTAYRAAIRAPLRCMEELGIDQLLDTISDPSTNKGGYWSAFIRLSLTISKWLLSEDAPLAYHLSTNGGVSIRQRYQDLIQALQNGGENPTSLNETVENLRQWLHIWYRAVVETGEFTVFETLTQVNQK